MSGLGKKADVSKSGFEMNRRGLLKGSVGLASAAAFAATIENRYALAQSEDPVKIGWLGDRTGNFSNVGIQKFGAANLAVKELNDNGGILGREVVLVSEDAQSDNRRYQRNSTTTEESWGARLCWCLKTHSQTTVGISRWLASSFWMTK